MRAEVDAPVGLVRRLGCEYVSVRVKGLRVRHNGRMGRTCALWAGLAGLPPPGLRSLLGDVTWGGVGVAGKVATAYGLPHSAHARG